ncbi:MAG: transcriptional repressor [Pseudomonadota bacterium]
MTKRGEKMQAEILGLLRAAGGAQSAYDVLYALRVTHPKIAPPTVYNALSALTKAGRVHRVESLKAYIACQCDGAHHASVLSICDACGTVEEHLAPQLVKTLSGFVEETGFRPQRHVIEVHGTCSECEAGTDRP